MSVYSASELSSAFGILMIVWCIFTVFMTIASMRTSLGLASLRESLRSWHDMETHNPPQCLLLA